MAAPHSSSNSSSIRNTQTSHIDDIRQKTFKIDKKYHFDQPSYVPGPAVVRSVNKQLEDAVDYRNYRLSKKSSRYENEVANELNKMTKNIAVQMKNRSFSGKDSVSIITYL